MKVEIINPETVKKLYKEHGTFACECYDTDIKYAEKVGKSCQQTKHYSGSRTEYIKFRVTGVDRGIAEQALRHEIGVRHEDFVDALEQSIDINPATIVKNMKSFRYVDMANQFDYTTPGLIEKSDKAKKLYKEHMKKTHEVMKEIKEILTEENPNTKKKIILEESQYLLPRATNTSFTIGFTTEALIHYMHKRLCVRAQTKHRELAVLMKKEVIKLLPEFEKVLVPHCEHLLWCPEGKMSCGRYHTKDELKARLENNNG